jgi:c-di-GMP-binding flagellar brake protein YcgR
MVSHSSELTFNLTTPVGIKFLGQSNFIGVHSDNLIIIELPELTEDDQSYFFQEGFWMNIRAISQRGEGALIHFRAQIMHILLEPVPMVLLSIPPMMQVSQLRKEARYDVALSAIGVVGEQKIECEMRDLSKGGCRIVTSILAKTMQIGDKLTVHITHHGKAIPSIPPVAGTICNLQSSQHYAKYGLKFNDEGQNNVKTLLAKLKFDGSKLALKV